MYNRHEEEENDTSEMGHDEAIVVSEIRIGIWIDGP